jgi:hypothetical protein
MVPRPTSSCFVDFTTELIRRCGGVVTQLDPDDYGIWLRFESTAFGTDYFLHYEGPMADFRGIFDNFRPVINRDYVLTGYQIEGEFADAICPDPIEEITALYTEERSCDICEESATQRDCECDGGTPLRSVVVTISGSVTSKPLFKFAGSDGICDPYPGFGISDPDGNTLYNPLNDCNQIAGTYVVPCQDGLLPGDPGYSFVILNHACDAFPSSSGDRMYYYLLMVFSNVTNAGTTFIPLAGVTIIAGLARASASLGLSTGTLMDWFEFLDLIGGTTPPGSVTFGSYSRQYFREYPVTLCVPGDEITLCELLPDYFGDIVNTGTEFDRCDITGLTVTISQ